MSMDPFLDALDLSDDAKTALRNIKVEIEAAYLDEIHELRADNARLQEANQRLRLWNLTLRNVITHVIETFDGRPLGVTPIKRLEASLVDKPDYPNVGGSK